MAVDISQTLAMIAGMPGKTIGQGLSKAAQLYSQKEDRAEAMKVSKAKLTATQEANALKKIEARRTVMQNYSFEMANAYKDHPEGEDRNQALQTVTKKYLPNMKLVGVPDEALTAMSAGDYPTFEQTVSTASMVPDYAKQLSPEALSKPAAKDFTQESVKQYLKSGDQGDLVPRETGPGVKVVVGGEGTEFDKAVGKAFGKDFVARRKDAQDASKSLRTSNEAVDLLNSGIVTGTGAELITSFGKALKKVSGGIYKGEAEANTEAYMANQAKAVANIIKAFGAGTGLSDADREYAEKAAAGKITMTEESLRKIIDINNRASRYVIQDFNEDAKALNKRGTIPFDISVEIPEVKGAETTMTDEEYEARKKELGL